MELRILYFAHVRQSVGRSSESLAMTEGATVGDALMKLKERYPTLEDLLPVVRVALNGEFRSPETLLSDDDELVLIPPVAGGSGFARVAITVEPLDREHVRCLQAAVSGPEHGAVVTFEGVVRNHARGRVVERIDYEAYETMALEQMRRIVAAVESETPPVQIAVHHRVGSLEVGDTAVVVVTASPHRREAFVACQLVIERLKADVPIWKHEVGPDGAEWVSDRP